ncbi:4-hydroxythreonine-4-phosphate dehydrogenase PdxA [uncultured Cohaesibacter sp.]|uniref:4-hydroxythreonine-4-phosphate dehydrogenase PdxA n=1 Tax=uncultured Cohaesibacter sp. TaxID=1002546 RepID=UPI002930BED4|nr:4-hydroxythreonine-4-phosphate dehydrogenase PdxA [uncultured Cohaesibacter sp.]
MSSQTDILAMSIGEPAGIGPELALKAWLARDDENLPPFVVFGDPQLLAERAKRLSLSVPVRACNLREVTGIFPDALPVLPLNCAMTDHPGHLQVSDAPGVIEAIEKATIAAMAGDVKAVVTCPIQKKNLYDFGFEYPGHTEFLGALVERKTGKKAKPVMMLAGPELRTVPVTCHIPIEKVSEALTPELLEETARITLADLAGRFGIANPRLAITGLNPHAGEAGSMGSEDLTVIAPVIETLRKEGFEVTGPHPADTLFNPRARKGYDAVLAMYHDQALIPVKTIAFDETVNVTLGLPFIRTSPDHGTALDIASKGIANPSSLIAALKLAGQLKP